jgi:hypothetical protein
MFNYGDAASVILATQSKTTPAMLSPQLNGQLMTDQALAAICLEGPDWLGSCMLEFAVEVTSPSNHVGLVGKESRL